MRHNSTQIYKTFTHKAEFEKDINLVCYVHTPKVLKSKPV